MPPALVDPFDLPDWLAQEQVLWQPNDEKATASIRGLLRPILDGQPRGEDGDRPDGLPLDLLAVDAAWPTPVCDEDSRRHAHECWHYGEVALLDRGGRITLGVPGIEFSADLVCEAVRRFSRAVGGDASRFLVQLRL
ncbi:MAG: hypothetical protein ACRDOY_09560 [Nocardioidaceae bacterium]